jgi:hypothetical protein
MSSQNIQLERGILKVIRLLGEWKYMWGEVIERMPAK